ncbi:MAG: tol-pal system protein YbgF [Deltaproteobacteria bacterium]|nr:MAG: tol-pal system protein YbgF [Deltaproteobacteria bacterium]
MVNIVIKIFIVLSVFIFFLTSCASQKDIIYLNNQVNALYRQSKKDEKRFEKSLKKFEEKIKAHESAQKETVKSLNEDKRRLNKDQESIRLHLAQVEADLLEIKDKIQELTGRVEENSHRLKGAIEEDTTNVNAMVSKMKELSSMLDQLKPRIEKVESSLRFKPSVTTKTTGPEKGLPVQETPKKDISTLLEKKLTESETYDRALWLYRDDRYEEAMAAFKNFLTLYPTSDLADNAHFWIGECYRALTRYEEAILAYQKVINGYPKGNKVPSAMLQQAITFEKINDTTTANLIFKKLVKNFPKAKEAEIARKRLRKK